MDVFSAHQSHLEKYLTKSQILTLQLLIWLLQVQKDVRIERLASCLPIPILYLARSFAEETSAGSLVKAVEKRFKDS